MRIFVDKQLSEIEKKHPKRQILYYNSCWCEQATAIENYGRIGFYK